MKGNFDKCLEMVLEHEGGFVNHPKDPGGATNMGITLATYEQCVGRSVSIDEMKNLTFDDVAPIYLVNYWDAVRGDDLPSGVDWSAFDWAVNSGPSRSAKALQKIVMVRQDGMIGPITLAAVHSHDAKEVIEGMYYARQRFYENLSTFETFGRGWSRRNRETLRSALDMV